MYIGTYNVKLFYKTTFSCKGDRCDICRVSWPLGSDLEVSVIISLQIPSLQCVEEKNLNFASREGKRGNGGVVVVV